MRIQSNSPVIPFLSLLMLGSSALAWANDPSCERALVRVASEAELAALSEKLSPKIEGFAKALNGRLLERDYLIELGLLSILAQEHLLLMGPPGNAKSMFADEFMTHIVEQDSGDASYFRLQLTPETTMSETHGPVNWKTLPETGRLERHYDQGMLFSKLVFTDEIFDARANTLRNLLGMYNERAHAQGVEIVKGKIETVFAATNRYISEVYERAGDDGPKAVLDRFTFSSFVPGSFESLESVVSIIQGAKRSGQTIPKLRFSELEELRALVPQVEIPDFEAEFLAIFSERFRLETESLEQASLREYRQKQRNGEVEIDPPYRATKYISGRTIGKAASMLRAIVVRDWLAKGGSRKLEANLSDVRKLRSVFTLNGPSDSYIEMELERATNPHERVQLQTIQQEREIFDRIFDEMNKELNETLYEHAFVELTERAAARGSLTEAERQELSEEIAGKLLEVREQLTSLREQAQTSLEQRESSWSPRRMALEKLEETYHSELTENASANEIEALIQKVREKRQEEEKLGMERAREEAPSASGNKKVHILKSVMEFQIGKDAKTALNISSPQALFAVSEDGTERAVLDFASGKLKLFDAQGSLREIELKGKKPLEKFHLEWNAQMRLHGMFFDGPDVVLFGVYGEIFRVDGSTGQISELKQVNVPNARLIADGYFLRGENTIHWLSLFGNRVGEMSVNLPESSRFNSFASALTSAGTNAQLSDYFSDSPSQWGEIVHVSHDGQLVYFRNYKDLFRFDKINGVVRRLNNPDENAELLAAEVEITLLGGRSNDEAWVAYRKPDSPDAVQIGKLNASGFMGRDAILVQPFMGAGITAADPARMILAADHDLAFIAFRTQGKVLAAWVNIRQKQVVETMEWEYKDIRSLKREGDYGIGFIADSALDEGKSQVVLIPFPETVKH